MTIEYRSDLACTLPLFVVDVHDFLGVMELDPVFPASAVVRLAAPFLKPVLIQRDGRDLLTITPTDSSQPARDLTLPMYEAILTSAGHDRQGEPREDYLEEARAGAERALRDTPRGGLATWEGRREDVARRTMVADLCAGSFLVPGAVAGQIAGAPPPARTFWSGQDAGKFDEARRRREQADAAAKAVEEAIRVEAARPKSIGEKGIVVIEVKHDRLGVAATEPYGGARVLWRNNESTCFGFLCVPAMHMPAFERHGVKSLGPDEVASFLQVNAHGIAQPIDASPGDIGFLQARRAEVPGLDFGRIKDFTLEIPEVARELARKWAATIMQPSLLNMWRKPWLCEVLVRSLRLRPELSLQVILEAADEVFRLGRPPLKIPVGYGGGSGDSRMNACGSDEDGNWRPLPTTLHDSFEASELPSNVMGEQIAALLAAAATRGVYVSAGEALTPPPSNPKKRNKGDK